MPLPTFYATGSASVANGATTITFAGALLGTAELPTFRAGDLYFAPDQPLVPGQRLASVDYDAGTAELWVGWPGTSMTADPYEVRFTDDGVRSTAQTRRYLEMLGQLEALGVQPDALGDIADRDLYDEEKEGFIFLSLTPAPWTLYAKVSDADADWDAGQPQEGAPGPAGQPGSGMMVAVSDEVTPIGAGVAKLRFRAPNAMELSAIRASLNTASSSGPVTVDVNVNGATILSTKLTIDQGETTSLTAAVAAVISNPNIADDALISIDIDGAGVGAVGLKLTFIAVQP